MTSAEREYERLDREVREVGGDLRVGVPLDLLARRMAALRAMQDEWCRDGFHDDPDHSGACIRCGAMLYQAGS